MSEFSWVTLATNDSYSLGALVLAHSLKRVGTQYQLVVMVTPGVTQPMREKLAAVFDLVFEVNILDSKDERNLLLLQRPELGITFTKLHCWRLTQFKKCVFLDADTLVLQNCDELFERDEFSAAPDVGWPDCFNSGVFVYAPSDDTFNSLLTFALERGSFDGGDQGLLNLYFSDWAHKDISKHLPFIYNMCSTACYSYLPAFKQFGENVKIIHFIGNSKPWLQYFNSETLQVTPTPGFNHLQMIFDHWWNLFCAHVHSNLAASMGGLAGAFAQMTLREPKSASQGALEEHLRRQGWEAGRIDYLGQDSFDNVWKKICETISAAPVKEPSPPKQLPVKEPSPPKQIVAQPVKEPSPPKQVEVQPSAPAAALETTAAPVVAASESAPLSETASTTETTTTSAPVVPSTETPVVPAPETPASAPVVPTPETVAPVVPTPETAAPVVPTPETAAPVTPTPEIPAPETTAPTPVAPAPEAPVASAPVAPAVETQVAPTPETQVAPTTEAQAVPTPEAQAVPTSEAQAAPVAPTPEVQAAPVAPTPETQAAPEAVSPVEPTPVPDTTTPVVAAEPAVPVAPSTEPTPASVTEASPTTAEAVAAPEPAAPSPTPAPVSAAPAATPAPIADVPKLTETKAEEQKPKEAEPAATVTEEPKAASEVPQVDTGAAAPPTITETPATPQTPDASKGDIKPAPPPAAAAAATKPAEGQSTETPVPPPRKSGKTGGATTKKSSKKK